MFDYSSRAADIIEPIHSSTSSVFLLTWFANDNRPEESFLYRQQTVQPHEHSVEKDSKPNTELIRHYNQTITSLHHQSQSQSQLPEHTVNVINCSYHGHNNPSKSWLIGELAVQSGARILHVSIATAGNLNERDNGLPQRIYCHIHELGTTLEYCRYSLLSYGESLRAKFQVDQAVDILRKYTALMPCKVLQVLKNKGDKVKKGEAMLIVESMKTEMKIIANVDGTFEPKVSKGDAVEDGVLLCELV